MNKKHVIKSTLIAFACTIGLHANAQTTINAASNTLQLDGMVFEYSIGEMPMITTERNANLTITQGYLQPFRKNNAPSSDESSFDDFAKRLNVYPNPTENVLFIETNNTTSTNLDCRILDGAGKTVLQRKEALQEGVQKISLDMSSFAVGSYFLLLQSDGQNPISYKIQKSN